MLDLEVSISHLAFYEYVIDDVALNGLLAGEEAEVAGPSGASEDAVGAA